jgi:hypothetical protein
MKGCFMGYGHGKGPLASSRSAAQSEIGFEEIRLSGNNGW